MFKGTWYLVTEIQFRSICFHVRKILITPVFFSGGHFFFQIPLSQYVSNLYVLCNCLFITLSAIFSLEENNYNLILSYLSVFKGLFVI